MAIETMQELFIEELGDAMGAEQIVLQGLGEMIGETRDREVKTALKEHKRETQEHVRRLRQVFRMLKMKPPSEGCPGMEGLIKEKKRFNRQKPSAELLAYYNFGAAEKVERYEITAYEGLVEMAEKLQLSEAVDLLQQTLQEEQRMLERVKSLEQNFDTSPLMGQNFGAEEEVEEWDEEEVA